MTERENRYIDFSSETYRNVSFSDIHCHCLAGIDDGPATQAESLALCQALVDDGITEVAATPHQLGRFSGTNEAAQIRREVAALNQTLKSAGVNLTVFPGGDVRVDECICELIATDKILTIADGRKYILLELPHQVFLDIEPLLADLTAMGIQSVISHPERHPVLGRSPQGSFDPQTWSEGLGIPSKWFDYPLHLQITAGSLLGQFGPHAQRAGWHFLKSGIASIVATDCHDLGTRKPCMKAAFQIISAQLGRLTARRVCIDNPANILKGMDIEFPRKVMTRMSINESLPANF